MLLVGFVLLSVTALVSGDDKKPAAIAASTTGSTASGGTANAKPAAVQASTTKGSTEKPLSYATHLNIERFSVHLEEVNTAQWGKQLLARNLAEAELTVEGRGLQTKFAGSEKGPNDPQRFDGLTAFQILVEQGCFVHHDGVGFILLDACKGFVRKKDDRQKKYDEEAKDQSEAEKGEANQEKKKGKTFMGSDGDLDIKSDQQKKTEEGKMVDPAEPEVVADDPSQKGSFGLFGKDWTVDENCMAGRSKMYSDCTDRCKDAKLSSEEFGECTEKCGKDSLSAYGDCEGAAPRWDENQ